MDVVTCPRRYPRPLDRQVRCSTDSATTPPTEH